MSGVFLNIDPPPPHWVERGLGWSIFWKTPDTALYYSHMSVLRGAHPLKRKDLSFKKAEQEAGQTGVTGIETNRGTRRQDTQAEQTVRQTGGKGGKTDRWNGRKDRQAEQEARQTGGTGGKTDRPTGGKTDRRNRRRDRQAEQEARQKGGTGGETDRRNRRQDRQAAPCLIVYCVYVLF
jgi:hypothetical protein